MKVLIAMSGGVDSSVAAALLKKNGYDPIGATMRLFEDEFPGAAALRPGAFEAIDLSVASGNERPDHASGGMSNARTMADNERSCCSLNDVEDARAVSRRLHIPYYVFNFKNEFRSKVMDKFVTSYLNGMTPNPCIDCNRFLKFGALYQLSQILGCEYIATGHYARVHFNEDTGRFELLRARDLTKDQSYVLYFLSQEELKHTLFPLGEYTKAECRMMAEDMGFLNAKKHESQDICFIPDGDHASFIKNYTGKDLVPGNFVDESGRILGRHKGLAHYTIGQRKGLGLSLGHPVFVKDIHPDENEVVLSSNVSLFSDTLYARDFNWISMSPSDFLLDETHTEASSAIQPRHVLNLKAKIRYRHDPASARIYIDDPTDKSYVRIVFDEPQRAITKGQAVVVYDGERVVGGGTIDRVPK